jgi:hypothetical protein
MGSARFGYRMVAVFSTKEDCDRQAERQARAHPESGFDHRRDAWWGKSNGVIYYYHQTAGRAPQSWYRLRQILGYAER